MDVPAGVTQEEGHTGFLIHLLSAVHAFIFLARRIQPFLSLVDREVEFLCTNDLIVLHPLGIFIFVFYFFNNKIAKDAETWIDKWRILYYTILYYTYARIMKRGSRYQ